MPKVKNLVNRIFNDDNLRRELTKKSHFWFFNIYLADYVKYKTAPFQKEMFAITEDENIKKSVIVAFRDSGKSTIMTLSLPLWAVLGKLQKKYILIISQTQAQAKQHFYNIKSELENNSLLRSDLGPFKDKSSEWGSLSLEIPRFNARISALSTEQSIRGLRHGPHRPDLIICDDIEDLNSVKTREGRNKTYKWLTGDVFLLGSRSTKIINIGNLLHKDSVMMRLKEDIEEKRLDAIFRSYPLIDDNNKSLWPGKFPNEESIMELKRSIGDIITFKRECLLEIVSEKDQIIDYKWIKHYNKIPDIDDEKNRYRKTVIGVDPAITEKDTGCFTAIVSAHVFGWGNDMKVYILPHPTNQRLSFSDTKKEVKRIYDGHVSKSDRIKMQIYTEDVSYQRVLTQELEKMGLPVEGVPPHGLDKRTRLYNTTDLFQNGSILFPEKGTKKMIQQITGFGIEKYDDLVDAFSLLVNQVVKNNRPRTPFVYKPQTDPRYKPITAGLLDKEF